MKLRTDYKDAMFDGARKYRIIQNQDGTSGITDETVYTQKGDQFGANDINSTNGAINAICNVFQVTLTTSGWTDESAPYTQTVEVEGMKAEYEPILVRALSKEATSEEKDAYDKAFGIIASGTGETEEGTVTFRVFKKPETDCKVGLKGV